MHQKNQLNEAEVMINTLEVRKLRNLFEYLYIQYEIFLFKLNSK